MKLLSWNIWGGIFLPQVIEFIQTAKADVIALQEVEEGKETNTAKIIADSLGYTFIYGRSMPYERDGITMYRGNAVLSKFPIIEHVTYELSRTVPRVAVQADLDVEGEILHVTSVHVIHSETQPSQLQEEQVDTLLSKAPMKRSVIMGDFNMEPKNSTIKKMKSEFRDVDSLNTSTWCLYPDGPELYKPERVVSKLDYIFVSPDVKASNFQAEDSRGSDHLPISVMVQL